MRPCMTSTPDASRDWSAWMAPPPPQAETMHEFIAVLSPRIRSLYVSESVYMRYRSLCAPIEAGGNPAALIEACLHDGVLFDVA